MMTEDTVLVDGVHAVAFHNGVHRVTFFRFDGAGKPQQVLSLAIPDRCTKDVIDAFNKMKR
jgi:hypothetical protein